MNSKENQKQRAKIQPNGYIRSEQYVDALHAVFCCAQFHFILFWKGLTIQTHLYDRGTGAHSMVRETRHLWVGNLPENVREEKIIEHFKR